MTERESRDAGRDGNFEVKWTRDSPLPDRLRQLRTAVGLSQQELARAVGGRSAALVSHWESGRRKPREEDIRKLADTLQVDPRVLIDPSAGSGAFLEAALQSVMSRLVDTQPVTAYDRGRGRGRPDIEIRTSTGRRSGHKDLELWLTRLIAVLRKRDGLQRRAKGDVYGEATLTKAESRLLHIAELLQELRELDDYRLGQVAGYVAGLRDR